jgi:hypothetical protein
MGETRRALGGRRFHQEDCTTPQRIKEPLFSGYLANAFGRYRPPRVDLGEHSYERFQIAFDRFNVGMLARAWERCGGGVSRDARFGSFDTPRSNTCRGRREPPECALSPSLGGLNATNVEGYRGRGSCHSLVAAGVVVYTWAHRASSLFMDGEKKFDAPTVYILSAALDSTIVGNPNTPRDDRGRAFLGSTSNDSFSHEQCIV